MSRTPMTVSEADAVLRMHAHWHESGCSVGFTAIEASAWLYMVEAARERVAAFERGPMTAARYPGSEDDA